jgi:hypothetical protein
MLTQDAAIPPWIDHIKSLNLTQWGKIRLSAFPEAAIRYAEKEMKGAKGLREPFSWYFSVCLKYCKQANLKLEWGRVTDLEIQMGMPESAPMLIKAPISTAPREEARVGMVKENKVEMKRELTTEELVREEMKLMALRSDPFMGSMIPKPINETVEMAAKALGPTPPPSSDEIAARIQARLKARMDSMRR